MEGLAKVSLHKYLYMLLSNRLNAFQSPIQRNISRRSSLINVVLPQGGL